MQFLLKYLFFKYKNVMLKIVNGETVLLHPFFLSKMELRQRPPFVSKWFVQNEK